ncbi:MAG TPA: hypothetical protein DCS97_00580 [Planctomycetes bacterium]|nr:hypothetical protein [Planctomycetota bacterium]
MVREAILDDRALLRGCELSRIARGGPGGQHANKTASGVRLTHRRTGLSAWSGEHREGAANQRVALARLRLEIACAVRGCADPAWLPPHVRGGRLACGPAAASWPLVIAVLLDLFAAARGSLVDAAAAARLSPTQLAKALTAGPPVRRTADAIRVRHGLSPLRA